MKNKQDQHTVVFDAKKEERLAKLFNQCMALMNTFYRQSHALVPCKVN